MDLHLGGRVALITGGGGGIGRELVILFAEEGAAVAVGDVSLPAAEATAGAGRRAGGESLALSLDVTEEAAVQTAVARTTGELGPVDVLINCAGIYRVGELKDVHPQEWHEVLDSNLTGTYLMCRAVLPGMLDRRRGSIVNLASISGRTKSVLAAPSYVASKAGIIGLTMSLASQCAAGGVRVNAVAPGPVDTDMIRRLPADQQSRLIPTIPTIPMGRLGTPREVAQAIAFLASDAASFITGETLNVNGGAFMI